MAQGIFADPSGIEFERDVVHHPGAVSVVPVVDEGSSVLLVRQYRAAVDRDLLEIPAGKRDVDGEPVELTAPTRAGGGDRDARRDGSRSWREFYNSPGFCDEHSFVFMALDLEPCTSSAQGVEEQHMTIERISFEDVPELIATGALIDAKSIIGLTLARGPELRCFYLKNLTCRSLARA